MKRSSTSEILPEAKRPKLTETYQHDDSKETPENNIASTLPIEIIALITSYTPHHTLGLHTPSRLNKHWKRCMEEIHKKDLSRIRHIVASASTCIHTHLQASQRASVFELGEIFGIPLVSNEFTGLYECSHAKVNQTINEDVENAKTRIVCNALHGACIRGEISSVLRIAKELMETHSMFERIDDLNNLAKRSLVSALQSPNVDTFDAIYHSVIADRYKMRVSPFLIDFDRLLERCPENIHESVALRLTRMLVFFGGIVEADHVFMLNTTHDMDDTYAQHLDMVTFNKSGIFKRKLISIWSHHLSLLEAPVIKIMLTTLWRRDVNEMGLSLLDGSQECFDWFAKNAVLAFWQNVHLSCNNTPGLRSGLVVERIYERIVKTRTANENNFFPGLIVRVKNLHSLLLHPTASAKCFVYACHAALLLVTAESITKIRKEMQLDQFIIVILRQFSRLILSNNSSLVDRLKDSPCRVPLLIEKLKSLHSLISCERKQWTIRCGFTTVMSPTKLHMIKMYGLFLQTCVEEFNVHFVPNDEPDNALCLLLVQSETCAMRLWLRWVEQVKSDPSLRIGLTYFVHSAIALKQYHFLQWVVAQDSSYILIDHHTGVMIEDLWCECLMSRDMKICSIFDGLRKPNALIYPRLHRWHTNTGEVEITGSPYDIAIQSHDLEWIHYVAQYSPPQPKTSLMNLIDYLSFPNISSCPPWAINLAPMSHELILHLVQELSSLESPSTIIPKEKVVNLMNRLMFDSDIAFYKFCQSLWNIGACIPRESI
jgi:hypothetical protein